MDDVFKNHPAPQVLQPTPEIIEELKAKAGANEDEKTIVLPSDIVGKDNVATGEARDDAPGMGSHWYEIMGLNDVQTEAIKVITKEIEDLHTFAQNLKLWLDLEVPLIEDGNSFGAEVQSHIIGQCLDTYKKCNAMQNSVRSHHTDRIKLAIDWAKCPNFEDLKAAIITSDRFDHFLLRTYLRNILISYGSLLTKFERNWPKVINPKGSSSSSSGMY